MNRTGSACEGWLPTIKEGKYLSLLSRHVPLGWSRWQGLGNVSFAVCDIKVIFSQWLRFKLTPLPQRRPSADPPSSHLLATFTCCRYKRRCGRTVFEVPPNCAYLWRKRKRETIKRKEKGAHASRLSRELNHLIQTRDCPITDSVFLQACTGGSAWATLAGKYPSASEALTDVFTASFSNVQMKAWRFSNGACAMENYDATRQSFSAKPAKGP